MFIAAVLDPLGAGLLRWIAKAEELEGWGFQGWGFHFKTPLNDKIPHHMTVNLGAIDVDLNEEGILERRTKLHVDQIRISVELGACAARVIKAEVEMKEFPVIYWQNLNSINEHPHITICLKEGVKPFISNKLFETDRDFDLDVLHLDEVYVLPAVVNVCA